MTSYELIFRNGPDRGATVSIQEDRLVIGRSTGCHVVLETPDVSRKHCMIVRNSEGVYARDLSSRNGTKVNGRDIADVKAVKLKHRDKLQVGKWKFRLIEHNGSSVLHKAEKRLKPPTGSVASPQDAASKGISPTAPSAELDVQLQTDVLNELDAIAESLDISVDDVPMTRAAIEEAESEKPQTGYANAEANSSEGGTPKSANSSPASDAPRPESTESAAREGESATTVDDDEAPPEHNRLPDHLRPKGPVDSQDAADKALRRMFGA